jgi:hypothetical protein
MLYEICEFCPLVEGASRKKTLPFGNKEASILVIIPHFVHLNNEEKEELTKKYADARFIGFPACHSVENLDAAELVCGVLLRNEARKFPFILMHESPYLRKAFNIPTGSDFNDGSLKVVIYSGRVGDSAFEKDYKRLK